MLILFSFPKKKNPVFSYLKTQHSCTLTSKYVRYKFCIMICENILNILLFLAKYLKTHWEVITVFILFSWLSSQFEQL